MTTASTSDVFDRQLVQEVPIRVASWALSAAECLDLSLAYGTYYFVDRRLIVIPKGHFKTLGMQALVGIGIYNKLAVKPFLGYLLLRGPYVDPLLMSSLSHHIVVSDHRTRTYRMLCMTSQAVWDHLNGKNAKLGVKASMKMSRAVKKGRLPADTPPLSEP